MEVDLKLLYETTDTSMRAGQVHKKSIYLFPISIHSMEAHYYTCRFFNNWISFTLII